jgi:hypothetical protein
VNVRLPDLDTGNPVTFGNANGVSFGTNGDTITASVAAVSAISGIAVNGATTYTSGTVVFSNSNGVSFGTNGQTITASVAAVSAISGVGVNGGAATTNGTIVFSNSNNVTFGGNGSTITASASYSQSTAPGAIQAGTQTATSGTVIFSNSNNVTFGMAGTATITASVTYAPTLTLWHNVDGGFMMQGSTFNTLSVVPLAPGAPFPGQMTASTVLVGINGAGSQSTASGSMLFSFGIYTNNGGTLSLLNSVATSLTYAAVSNNSTAHSGFRWLSIHSSQWSAQPAFSQKDYWLGYIVSSSNATQNRSTSSELPS